MSGQLRNFAIWTVIIVLLLALFTLFQNPDIRSDAPTISFSQLLNEVEQGRVRELVLTGQDIRGSYTDGRRFQSYGPNEQTWIDRAQRKGVFLTIRPASDEWPPFVSVLISWLPFFALIAVWIFLSSRIKRSTGNLVENSRTEIDGLKRQIADMQAQIDRLRLGDK